MITKEEASQYVQLLAEQQILTRDELTLAYDSGMSTSREAVLSKRVGVAEILYYIGGLIVILGIAILLGQNWSTLGFATKILVTLGVGVVAYAAGWLLSRNQRTEAAGVAFYFISSFALPVGIGVVLDKLGFATNGDIIQSLMSGVGLVIYGLSWAWLRRSVFILLSILFGTWLYFSLTSWGVNAAGYGNDWHLLMYRTLVAGIVYILMGYAFSKHRAVQYSSYLYGFGILGVLGAALWLGGWEPDQSLVWELIYPVLVFGALFMSVRLKSRAFLIWGTVFLMAYILKITSEYFSTGLGWPLTLVIAGLAMIGAGYLSLSIKRTYLSATSENQP